MSTKQYTETHASIRGMTASSLKVNPDGTVEGLVITPHGIVECASRLITAQSRGARCGTAFTELRFASGNRLHRRVYSCALTRREMTMAARELAAKEGA